MWFNLARKALRTCSTNSSETIETNLSYAVTGTGGQTIDKSEKGDETYAPTGHSQAES